MGGLGRWNTGTDVEQTSTLQDDRSSGFTPAVLEQDPFFRSGLVGAQKRKVKMASAAEINETTKRTFDGPPMTVIEVVRPLLGPLQAVAVSTGQSPSKIRTAALLGLLRFCSLCERCVIVADHSVGAHSQRERVFHPERLRADLIDDGHGNRIDVSSRGFSISFSGEFVWICPDCMNGRWPT